MALRFWGSPQAAGSQGTLESSILQQKEPTGLRQHWLSSTGLGLTDMRGTYLLLPMLPRKSAVPSECAKAQECLLIFPHSSIWMPQFSDSILPAGAQARHQAECQGGVSKVRADPGGRQWPLGEGRAVPYHRVSCCWIISQWGTRLHLLIPEKPQE